MNKKSFNFRKNTLFAVLTAACLNGYAQQDSIKGKSSSKEEGNRNVMLNAASANDPHEISIGLPGGDVNVLEMKTNLFSSTFCLALALAATSCQHSKPVLSIEHQGDTSTLVHVNQPSKYLLLPIQGNCAEGGVTLDTGQATDTEMDIRRSIIHCSHH